MNGERWGERLARVGLVAIAGVQAAKCLADYDLPWHLALGREIARTHAIPKIDPLAFTHRPIGYMEFVSDVTLYGVMRIAGPLGLQLVGAICAIAIALFMLLRARGSGPTAFFVTAAALVAIGNWIIVRPATLSFVLLALVLWILERHRSDPSRRDLYALVPIMVLWVNVHGFSVIGLGIIGLYAGYRATCRLARERAGGWLPEPDGRDLARTALVAFVSLLASGLNLAGYRLLTAPFRAVGDFSRIGEWQTTSLSFLLEHELGVLAFIALALVALLLGKNARGTRGLDAFELGLFVLAVVLGRSALRMVPVAIVMVAPIVARRLGAVARPSALLSLTAGLTLPLAAPLLLINTPTSFGIGFEPRHFPETAIQWIEKNEPRGRMWNFLDFGGYLTWRLHPKHEVLVDGRSGWVHDPILLSRCHASLRGDEAFRGLVSEFDLQWAITRAKEGERLGAPLATSPDFTLVYLDDLAAVYVRGTGSNQALAEHGFRVLRHLTPPPVVLQAAVTGAVPAADLAHDGALAVEQAPKSARARFLDAAGAIALRDPRKLAEAHDALVRIAPDYPGLPVLDRAARDAGMLR